MNKIYKQLIILFLTISFSFFFFSSLIRYSAIYYNKKNDLSRIKNYIINLDKNLNENVFHYILYNHFIFKPFKMSIIDKNNNIIYSDFENTNFSDDFYFKIININNENYIYIFNLNDYINYINSTFYLRGAIKYKNKFYPNVAFDIFQDKYEFKHNDLLFYFFPSIEFKNSFLNNVFLFIIFNSILFFLLFLLMKKHYNYIINDIKILTSYSQKSEPFDTNLNIKESLLLKENIDNLHKTIERKNNKISEQKKIIDNLKIKNKELINNFIFSIKNSLQNLVDILTVNLSKELEKNTIIKNISELNTIINKFENIEIIDKTFYEKETFEFFDIYYFHKEVLYFLSYYLNEKNIRIIENIPINNSFIFSNKEKLHKILYELLLLLLKNKDKGNIEISYKKSIISEKDFLEIKIIDKNNTFNDYILLLDKSFALDYSNIESFNIFLIQKYLKDLNGNIYLNQIGSDVIIKLDIPIDYNDLIKNYDFNNLKNSYLTKLIEEKYTLNQANAYLKEIIDMYIQILDNPDDNNAEKLHKHLLKNNFYLLRNWIEYILKNPKDKKIITFRKILIKKLGSI
ncbi:hypothetical protein JCM30566_00880 [Marinitoga arctica]